ncbi:hypothetical protein MTBBW1_1390004 [Desulfamplus magnetovallimortis]|uniref:Uncharacterized protein n=1 Tax=Desulfamplus magnetovallimortis TaxID=1246637 RepID=A0A1W1H7Y3_9BACT|nr:hypothetical protein MTBBW1_1390004 [Desulfamplus magnetovallimortis]
MPVMDMVVTYGFLNCYPVNKRCELRIFSKNYATANFPVHGTLQLELQTSDLPGEGASD